MNPFGPPPGPKWDGEGDRGEKAEPLPRSGEPSAPTFGKDAIELKEACLDRSEPMTGELPPTGLGGAGAISAASSCPCIEEGVIEMAGESAGVMRFAAAEPSEALERRLPLAKGAGKELPSVLTLRPRVAANF